MGLSEPRVLQETSLTLGRGVPGKKGADRLSGSLQKLLIRRVQAAFPKLDRDRVILETHRVKLHVGLEARDVQRGLPVRSTQDLVRILRCACRVLLHKPKDAHPAHRRFLSRVETSLIGPKNTQSDVLVGEETPW